MNEKGCAVLIKAALGGRKQIKYSLHDLESDGACAIGLLYEDLTGLRKRGWGDYGYPKETLQLIIREYGVSLEEMSAIIRSNNEDDWDFLTIARKYADDPSSMADTLHQQETLA